MAVIDTGSGATMIEDPNSVSFEYFNVKSWEQHGEYFDPELNQEVNLLSKVTGRTYKVIHDPRIKEETPKKRGRKPLENKSANETE